MTESATVTEFTKPLVSMIEQVSQGDLVPVAGLSPPAKNGSSPPAWMKPDDIAAAHAMAEALAAEVRANPADVRLLARAQSLGKDGDRAMVAPLALYDKKVKGVLAANQEGSPINRTLLDLKMQMDLINPAVLRQKPLPVRFTLGILSRLPKGPEVLKMIYESRETVSTTVNGLVENLRVDADNLEANVEDLARIYKGLLDGQRLVERDIYVGHLTIDLIKSDLQSVPAGPERDNVDQFLADLSTQVVFLMDEEQLNYQFFAGAQAVTKITTAQLHQIRNLGRLLQRSVLANLALNVAASELRTSMELTRKMSDAIGATVRDTAGQLKDMGVDMARMRSQGGVSLEALEGACQDMEAFFSAQALANATIIEQAGMTMHRLADMSGRLRRRVEGGHESMVGNA